MTTIAKYRLVPVGDLKSEWDDFVKKSPQGSIFSCHDYLGLIGRPFQLFFVYKGIEVKAGVALNIAADGKRAELDDLVIYNGILFRNNPLQKEVKVKQEEFEIVEFVLVELDKKYDCVEMALHPLLQDLRPILWHNYHDHCIEQHYKVDLRYTSYLDISEFFLQRDEYSMKLFDNLDNVRQSDIRKARRDEMQVLTGGCSGLFVDFYSKLMGSQSKTVSNKEKSRIQFLIDSLLEMGLARLFFTRNRSGLITYITIFSLFENKACYLFGAGDMDKMSRYDGTICLWDAFRQLAMCGVNEVDMEGVNSPQRGWFKLSFGGTLVPYYQIYKGA